MKLFQSVWFFIFLSMSPYGQSKDVPNFYDDVERVKQACIQAGQTVGAYGKQVGLYLEEKAFQTVDGAVTAYKEYSPAVIDASNIAGSYAAQAAKLGANMAWYVANKSILYAAQAARLTMFGMQKSGNLFAYSWQVTQPYVYSYKTLKYGLMGASAWAALLYLGSPASQGTRQFVADNYMLVFYATLTYGLYRGVDWLNEEIIFAEEYERVVEYEKLIALGKFWYVNHYELPASVVVSNRFKMWLLMRKIFGNTSYVYDPILFTCTNELCSYTKEDSTKQMLSLTDDQAYKLANQKDFSPELRTLAMRHCNMIKTFTHFTDDNLIKKLEKIAGCAVTSPSISGKVDITVK